MKSRFLGGLCVALWLFAPAANAQLFFAKDINDYRKKVLNEADNWEQSKLDWKASYSDFSFAQKSINESEDLDSFYKKWDRVEKRNYQLRQSYNDWVKAGDYFFRYLELMADGIDNRNDKKIAKSRLSQKNDVMEILIKIDAKLDKADKMIAAGNDKVKLVKISDALTTLTESSDEFKNIEFQLTDLMDEIDMLTVTGIKIIEGY